MTLKEIKYQKALIDMQLGGLELRLALTHGMTQDQKQNILDQIEILKDKRCSLTFSKLS